MGKFCNGYAMCFMSMVCMATFAVVTKFWIVAPFILCLMTSLLKTIFSLALWKGNGPFISFKMPIIISGFCEVVDFIGRIVCVRYLPVSLAMAINASTPIYGVIIEAFVDPNRFSYSMKLKRFAVVIFICASIAIQSYGSLFDSEQSGHSDGSTLFGVFLSVMSAVARVTANFAIEHTTDDEIKLHHFIMGDVFGYLIIPCIIPFIMPMGNLAFSNWEKGFCIGILFLFCCYFCISTFSYHDIAVTTALAIRTLEIPTVFVIGTVFLGEPSNIFSILGCASVTFWCVYMVCFLSSEEVEEGEEIPLLKGSTLKRMNTTIMGGNYAALGVRARFEMALLLKLKEDGSVQKTFQVLDNDGDGALSPEELFSSFNVPSNTLRTSIFQDADKNGDGEVTQEEFESFARVLDDPNDEI